MIRLRLPMARRTAALLAVWVVALAVTALVFSGWLGDLTPPGLSWRTPREMADFRDTIWGPGRYLMAGGNPYDPDLYLAAHPWAQEFDPYAPAWLVLAVLVSLPPFPVSAAVYLVFALAVAVLTLRVLLRWAAPAVAAWAVPVGLLYLDVWSPGRYALQNGGTLLVVLGWVLVTRTLVRRPSDGADGPDDRRADWISAAGLAMTLLKPQFGVLLVAAALGAGRWRLVARGIAVLAAASAPVVVACSVAAGGFGEFLGSLVRLVSYASSPAASTGLLSPNNERVDLVGGLARIVGVAPPGWLVAAVPLLAAIACALIAGRARDPIAVTAGVAAATLLGLVHQPYDMIILIVPFALLIGAVLQGRRLTRLDGVIGALAAVPVLHLHRITTLVPGFSEEAAGLVDVVAVAAVLVLSAAAAVLSPRSTAWSRPV